MSTVQNTTPEPQPLSDGRMLAPGKQADVELTEHERERIETGALVVITGDSTIDLNRIDEHTIDEIVGWVGDDPDRRLAALAAERRRGESARRTLTNRLDEETT